jgi:RNA-binding protein NOB1
MIWFANISISGFSPFVMRDINSRSAMLGIRGTDIKSMMRRNPNDGRSKGKKKK